MTDDPLITYECPHGAEHAVPSEDVRVLKIGQAGFVIACDCGDEPLDETHEPPHPDDRHLVNVFGEDPSPEEWLALEELADDWYGVDAWEPVGDKPGVWAQVRQRVRDGIAEIAQDNDVNARGGADRTDVQAREVACPECGVNEGVKCERPSGHTVRQSHADRVERAREAGIIDEDEDVDDPTEQEVLAEPVEEEIEPEPLVRNDLPETEQDGLGAWSA